MRVFVALLVAATLSVGTANADPVTLGLLTKARETYLAGNFEEAERYSRLALESAQKDGDPSQLAEAMGDLGGVFLARGRYAQAKDLFLNALDPLRKTHNRYLSVVLNNLGVLSMKDGDYAQSEAYFKEALKTARSFGLSDPYQGRVLNNLGALYTSMKDIGRAEKALKNAIVVLEGQTGRDRVELASVYANLGAIHVQRKKWDSAAALLDKALFVLRDSKNPLEILANAGVLDLVAVMHHNRKHFDEAERAFRKAYETRRALLGEEHPLPLLTGVKLAATLMPMARYDEAEDLINDALRVYEKTSRSNSADAATALEQMAALLRETHREEGAKAVENRANTIRFHLEHTVRASMLR